MKTQLVWNEWWQKKNAADRFMLMNKYNIKSVNNKLIRRMYNKENL